MAKRVNLKYSLIRKDRFKSNQLCSCTKKAYSERVARRAKDTAKMSVLDSKHPERLAKVHTLTRSVHSPETCPFVVAFWLASLSKIKWLAQSFFAEITCITFASTIVSKKDTQISQPIAVHASGTHHFSTHSLN